MALMALGVAFAAVAAATFAWYIYNTSAHTTRVHMAAGTSVALYISNTLDGEYNSAAVLDAFTGTLNPVSTNKIQTGFQKVYGFTSGAENQPSLVASLFGASEASDYYKTSLYLKTDGASLNVSLSDIGFEDSDEQNPISTAIRVGFVVPSTGEEFVFAINNDNNPQAQYNTQNGAAGDVLDSEKTDGSTVAFTPLTSDNFCSYDKTSGTVSLLPNTISLCTATATPIEVDIYIWLEGCDEDCTQNLCATTLKNLALSFCGMAG